MRRTAVLLAATALASCTGGGDNIPEPPQQPAPPTVIAAGSVPAGDQTPAEPVAYVFRTEQAARRTLISVTGLRRPSFRSEAPFVAILGGQRPDAGYRVRFRSLDHEPPGPLILTADVERTGDIAAQVLSVPYVIVSLNGFHLEEATECELHIGAESHPCTVM